MCPGVRNRTYCRLPRARSGASKSDGTPIKIEITPPLASQPLLQFHGRCPLRDLMLFRPVTPAQNWRTGIATGKGCSAACRRTGLADLPTGSHEVSATSAAPPRCRSRYSRRPAVCSASAVSRTVSAPIANRALELAWQGKRFWDVLGHSAGTHRG